MKNSTFPYLDMCTATHLISESGPSCSVRANVRICLCASVCARTFRHGCHINSKCRLYEWNIENKLEFILEYVRACQTINLSFARSVGRSCFFQLYYFSYHSFRLYVSPGLFHALSHIRGNIMTRKMRRCRHDVISSPYENGNKTNDDGGIILFG